MPGEDRQLKRCPLCKEWLSGETILTDPRVHPLGMTVEPDVQLYLYYFRHDAPHCGTTFVVPITDFTQFILEEIPPRPLAGTRCCARRCAKLEDLSDCSQPCTYAPYRRLLLWMIKQRQGSPFAPRRRGETPQP